MATIDEQRMREQFEADAKETLHWSTVSLDRLELRPDEYAHGAMQYRWLGWQAACRSRDAEVQALKEVLYEIKFKAGMSHINQTMEQQQRLLYDISDAARAALAGDTKGKNDE